MSTFAKAFSAAQLGVSRVETKVLELKEIWLANKERWAVEFGVYVILAAILSAVVIGFPTSVNAQEGNLGTQLANYFTPANEQFQAVYQRNTAVLEQFGCWGCNVFNAFSASIFEAGERVGGAENGSKFAAVIVAFASVFSLFYIGSAFVSGDASDLLGRWKIFYRLMIAVAVSTAVLTTGGGAFSNAWRIIYGPLISVPLAVAKEVNGGGTGSACEVAPQATPDLAAAKKSLESMRGVVCDTNKISMKGLAFGMALAMSGSGFVGSIVNAALGLLVMVVFFYVAITFPLRFIDVLIRLAVVGVLTPVFVVCATFKQTRSYVQIGVSNILYCGCVFAFTSILFNLGIKFFQDRLDTHIARMSSANHLSIIASGFEIIGMALIFASFSRTAVSLAQEFSQFRGSAGHAGESAINFTNTIASTVAKGVAAGTSVSMQSLAKAMKGQSGSGGAIGGGSVGGGSATGSLGRGVTP